MSLAALTISLSAETDLGFPPASCNGTVIIESLCRELSSKGIDKVYLAVSTNNESAIKAYKKSGFIVEKTSCFIRFLKINIPYREL